MEWCDHQDLPCDSCIEIQLIQTIAKAMATEEVHLKDPDIPGAEMERDCMEEIFTEALREESETSGISAERKKNWIGSQQGRRFIDWERSRGPNTVNNAAKFREMNRMSVWFFHRIEEALASRDEYLTQRWDATGKLSHTHRASTREFHELLLVRKCWRGSSLYQCNLRRRVSSVSECHDLQRLRSDYYAHCLVGTVAWRFFPSVTGCIGSVDCQHCAWCACPSALEGTFCIFIIIIIICLSRPISWSPWQAKFDCWSDCIAWSYRAWIAWLSTMWGRWCIWVKFFQNCLPHVFVGLINTDGKVCADLQKTLHKVDVLIWPQCLRVLAAEPSPTPPSSPPAPWAPRPPRPRPPTHPRVRTAVAAAAEKAGVLLIIQMFFFVLGSRLLSFWAKSEQQTCKQPHHPLEGIFNFHTQTKFLASFLHKQLAKNLVWVFYVDTGKFSLKTC